MADRPILMSAPQRVPSPPVTRHPMWYDDFDGELYKVVPEAERLIAPVADVPMRTTCAAPLNGRLNHPSMWNGDFGMIAFFGCRLLGIRHWKPGYYWTDAPVVECTFEEAIRDTFVHECIAYVDGYPMWNTWKLRADFMTLMYHARGWPGRSAEEVNSARRAVLSEVARTCRRMSAVSHD